MNLVPVLNNPYRLLLADDNDTAREGLRRLLPWEDYGFEVAGVYADGRALIDRIGQGGVDAVITDIRMPFADGIEAARYIAEHGLGIEIILISAYRDFEYARSAVRYRVLNYLVKPYARADVETAVRELRDRLEIRRRSQLESIGLGSRQGDAAPPDDAEGYDLSDGEGSVLLRAKRYIAENLGEELSLERAAEHVHLSPVYFSRFFKDRCGQTFLSYVTEAKLDRAKRLLADPDKRVYEISALLGYRDIGYFNQLFKAKIGCTPTEYRAGMRPQ
jgi:YesN/AraC family two-component response regulator